jgi:hypothetical protein
VALVGLKDFFNDEEAGVLKPVEPEEGVAPATADEVRERLRALASDAIRVDEGDGKITVAWHAEIWNRGRMGSGNQEMVRALELTLDEAKTEVSGIGFTKDLDEGTGLFNIGSHHEVSEERGQFTGGNFEKVVSNLGGEHGATGGANQDGSYKFEWKDLRHSVIEAVTGAGWTYVPKKA